MIQTPTVIAVSALSFIKSKVLTDELTRLGLPIKYAASPRVLTASELSQFIQDAHAEIAIVGTEPVTSEVLAANPQLRLVAKYGVGLDNIDQAALAERRICLGWTAGVNRGAVAELALAFTLNHLRRVQLSHQLLRDGQWVKDGGRQLSECTIGIVGYGMIGEAFARLVRSFGAEVLVHDIADRREAAAAIGATTVALAELLGRSDVVSLHVPLTPQTSGLLSSQNLALMRPTALLINTARGPVVDFVAACRAVQDGRLGGFAADVFPAEPMDVTPWRNIPGLTFTPHIAGNSTAAVLAMGRSAITAVQEYLTKPPEHPHR